MTFIWKYIKKSSVTNLPKPQLHSLPSINPEACSAWWERHTGFTLITHLWFRWSTKHGSTMKGETTTTITLTNATFLIGALPLPIFYRAASWFFLNHAIYHIAPALFSDSEQFFVCITAEPSIVCSNAQMFTCVVWFGTKKNI